MGKSPVEGIMVDESTNTSVFDCKGGQVRGSPPRSDHVSPPVWNKTPLDLWLGCHTAVLSTKGVLFSLRVYGHGERLTCGTYLQVGACF